MTVNNILSEATKVMVSIAVYKSTYNTANCYSVYVIEKSQGGINKTFIRFEISHENSNVRERELGPYPGEVKAIEALKQELRRMIDEAVQDLNVDATKILMYPAWLL